MRVTPSDSWSWSYQSIDDEIYLGLRLCLDDGARYFFRTNFKSQNLANFPDDGAPFCILDANLLTDFTQGFEQIGLSDESEGNGVSLNMELSLNAVACARFVARPKRVIAHSFLPIGTNKPLRRGQVVSLYTKNEKVCDFIVLDTEQEAIDNVFRLMFVNSDFRINGLVLSVGAMIRVPRDVICEFRSHSLASPSSVYA